MFWIRTGASIQSWGVWNLWADSRKESVSTRRVSVGALGNETNLSCQTWDFKSLSAQACSSTLSNTWLYQLHTHTLQTWSLWLFIEVFTESRCLPDHISHSYTLGWVTFVISFILLTFTPYIGAGHILLPELSFRDVLQN